MGVKHLILDTLKFISSFGSTSNLSSFRSFWRATNRNVDCRLSTRRPLNSNPLQPRYAFKDHPLWRVMFYKLDSDLNDTKKPTFSTSSNAWKWRIGVSTKGRWNPEMVRWWDGENLRFSRGIMAVNNPLYHLESRWLATPKRWRFVRGYR